MSGWKAGMKVIHLAQRAWGVGTIVQVTDEGRRLSVRFAGREGMTWVSGRDQALHEVPAETPLDQPQGGGPLETLAAGQAGPASAFALHSRAVRLEGLRRADSLGALLSSRVHVLPYQVGAAGRILSDRIPRFVLADEVGLGKTIEAGLVFAGLRQLGIAERVLVIVPEHLAFQWLAELFHRFNALFTLLTPERIEELGGPTAALQASPLAIVPLELLGANADLAKAAAELPLDLVIVDEAHHLVDDQLHDAVAPVARASFGLLLLTATPVRLDPSEYFRLLSLVEPVPSSTLEQFLRRLEAHEGFAAVARELLADGSPEQAAHRLATLAPEDGFFRDPEPTRDALLAHLAEHYSLSSRLIRNRRVKVGAFTERVLRRLDIPTGGKREAAVKLCVELAKIREKVLVFGSDPEALRSLRDGLAQAGLEALLYDEAGTIEARDRLVARFRDPDGPMLLLSGESGGEGRNFQFAAHLVCYDLPESPLTLEQRIGRLDRLGQNRPVEIHLLPEPGEEAFLADLYEHEIGIFQEPVGGLDAVLASLPAELESLRQKPAGARDAFRRELAERIAVGRRAQHEGYDPLLDIRSASLPELSRLVAGGFQRLGEEPPDAEPSEDELDDELPEDDDAADASDEESDLEDADEDADEDEEAEEEAAAEVEAPPADAASVLSSGPKELDAAAVEQSLQTLSRWLEEELEELCADVGRRIGMEVDTDQNVHPFEVSFTLGSQLRIEALPGIEMPEESRTHLGSFWRQTAVARDELEWFATGHKLVEALVGLARDGDLGRAAVMRMSWAPRRGAFYARYVLRWPSPADLAPGSRVPSRQASRYLPETSIGVVLDLAEQRLIPGGATRLEVDLDDAPDLRTLPPPAAVLVAAQEAALEHAQAELEGWRERALERLADHGASEEERLVEAGFAGGSGAKAIEAALGALRSQQRAIETALRKVTLDLDAVALLVP